ncbi:hypothetical protein BCE75_11019 [Isoptericola sp. CG 20/1183]|uniref:Uncharacterized protein n=1 Tax=Isoptericola halotolerans TaxID=300560 RepID=A0ABX5EDZ9_9MICO|nr:MULTISPECIES: hypothetical protein [Isoptericola]PRZ04500.1 hypothetical protein BCL65_110162 [Isoptericola halotolerans]PRZ04602.1 hypothetical protein BCE75_11019 [Isoptericola sp. CG 20/1183]
MPGWGWTLLVVCALVLLGWIAWGVVRAGLALLREVTVAGRTFGAASERVSDAVARAEAARPDTSATMFASRASLHARVQGRRRAGDRRRVARRARQRATWQAWRSGSWLERRRAGVPPHRGVGID